MSFTIDDCQHFIITTLREGQEKSMLHSTSLSWATYDVALNYTVQSYMKVHGIPNSDDALTLMGKDYQEINQIRGDKARLTSFFSDALWELFRRKILRPGGNNVSNSYTISVQSLDEGFSVTEYGKVMSPRKNGHSTKRPFALQNIQGLNSQV